MTLIAVVDQEPEENRWMHDCVACVYLGTWKTWDQEANTLHDYDLYTCGKDTYVARFGNEGSEYASLSYHLCPDLFHVATDVPGTCALQIAHHTHQIKEYKTHAILH
jgi:hypothetical protein